MDREGFFDALRRQYTEEIRAAYLQCEYQDGKIDLPKLEGLLSKLAKNAKAEGLPPKDFSELVSTSLPEHLTLKLPSLQDKRAA